MATPVKNVAFTFSVSVEDFADPGVLRTNPTISAGDFKVSTDGATFADLTTTPTVDPAGSARIKVPLTAGEMNGDNVHVIWQDQSGPKEWIGNWRCIEPAPAIGPDVNVTTWRGTAPNVLISGRVDSNPGALQANVITAASINTAAITAVKFGAGAIDAAAIATDAITAAKIAANAITAAKIATGAVDADALAADALAAIAAAVLVVVAGTGLSAAQGTKLTELHLVHGLDLANPLVVDDGAATRVAGSVSQTAITAGDVTTIQRV